MPRNSYKVIVDGQVYAGDMELETALILVEALFNKWYHEPKLAITVQRESDEPVMAAEEKIELAK